MSGPIVRCERRDNGQTSEFRIVDAIEELMPAVRRAGFVERDGHWVKTFPADTPHLERAWVNFQRLIVPWLRQAVGLDPVPWQPALAAVCERLTGASVDWWLTGSAALAVRGIPVQPGDLDLVVSEAHGRLVGDLMVDGLVEPVAPADWFCAWWGRAMLMARVEWVAGVGSAADQPEPTDFGLVAAAHLEAVDWQGWEVRVPPLALQRASCLRRALRDRVQLIEEFNRRLHHDRIHFYGSCPDCGHDWREHPGGAFGEPVDGFCGECRYEVEHDQRETDAEPCRMPAASPPNGSDR